jgi:hypothetical protein
MALPRFLGSYGELGGEIELYGDWVPGDDPETVSEEMLGLAGYLENTAVPLLFAREYAIADTRERFETETDPSGTPWIDLDPDYLEEKIAAGKPADQILVRDGFLEQAATSEAAWLISDELLVFNPSVLPFYGAYHQTGTGDNATIAAFRAKKEEWRSKNAGSKGGKHLGGMGRGQNLPRRAFIGLSEGAVGLIFAEFDEWFQEGVDYYFGGTTTFKHTKGPHAGKTQTKVGGRFGPFI